MQGGSWFEINENTPTTLLIRRWKSLEDDLAEPRPRLNTVEFFEWKDAHDRAQLEMVPVLQEMKRRGFPVVSRGETK